MDEYIMISKHVFMEKAAEVMAELDGISEMPTGMVLFLAIYNAKFTHLLFDRPLEKNEAPEEITNHDPDD